MFVCLFKQTPLGIKADSKLAINQAKDGTKPNSEASLTNKGVQRNEQITFPTEVIKQTIYWCRSVVPVILKIFLFRLKNFLFT